MSHKSTPFDSRAESTDGPFCQVQAAAEGYEPDNYVTSDQVPSGRPGPSMIYKNMIELDVWSTQVA